MNHKIEKYIEENHLIEFNDNIIVALSGGADSISLLHFLLSIKEKYSLNIFACHVNHILRGKDAYADQKFVEDFCKANDVKLFVKEIDVKKLSVDNSISTELAGRKARYDFFQSLSKEYNAKVATAHTLSDNVETVLFNITRGSSIVGMCGIPNKRDYLIRPILCVTREEIEKYVEDNSLKFCTDKTNFENIYNRNKIRNEVVPVLKSINSDIEASIFRFTNLNNELVSYINKIVNQKINDSKLEYGYDTNKLLSLDDIILKFTIYRILKQNNIDTDNKHIVLIIDALKNGTTIDISKGYKAICSQNVFRIVKDKETDEFSMPLLEYDNVERISDFSKLDKNLKQNLIDENVITSETLIRYRQSGDTFTLANRKVTKSVKKLLNEEKVPSELRDDLLVVANGNEVLWIESIGVSENAKVNNSTKSALLIKEKHHE